MKLALIIPGFQSDPEDWCIPAFTNLARELAKSVDLHVFTLRYPHMRHNYRIGAVKVHALGGGAFGDRRIVGVSLLKLWWDALAAIGREHRRGKFDAIVGVWATESGWLATRAARRLGVPSLVHLAGGELTWLPEISYGNRNRGLAGRLVLSALQNADLITVPSAAMWRGLQSYSRTGTRRRDGLTRKAVSWPLGVDTTMFAPMENARKQSQQTLTFVAVGSLVPVKGHAWLLEAFAQLRDDLPEADIRLNIVGKGPLLRRLRARSAVLGLEGYVNFVDEAPHDRLSEIYHEAGCFILTSWHEAQCMAALEAVACGLQWVGPPVGALADMSRVAPGETPSGIVVNERTPVALAKAMKKMVEMQPIQREAWGQAGSRRVRQDYELRTQTAQLLDLLRTLTSSSAAARISYK